MAPRKPTAAQEGKPTPEDQAKGPVPDAQGDPTRPAGPAAAPDGPAPDAVGNGLAPAAVSDGGLRAATAASPIAHDGAVYRPGDLVPLTAEGFAALRLTGALAEASWDDCSEF